MLPHTPPQTPAMHTAWQVFCILAVCTTTACTHTPPNQPKAPTHTPPTPKTTQHTPPPPNRTIPFPPKATALEELESSFKSSTTPPSLPQHNEARDFVQRTHNIAKRCTKHSPPLSEAWGSCVCKRLCFTTFPPPANGSSVTIQLPFVDVDGLTWHIKPTGTVQRCSYSNLTRGVERLEVQCDDVKNKRTSPKTHTF